MKTISVYVDDLFAEWLKEHAARSGQPLAKLGGEMLMQAGPHDETAVCKVQHSDGRVRVSVPKPLVASLGWDDALALRMTRWGDSLSLAPLA